MVRRQAKGIVLTAPDIARLRLVNQRITEWAGPPLHTLAAVVAWLVASQAQDWYGAIWAVGLRTHGAADAADVEAAFDRGAILRTHLLRPTWHFVTPADIRWLLALTGPRVQAASAAVQRRRGLDADTLRRSDRAIEHALRDGPRMREELRRALDRAGLPTTGENRLAHLLMHAELQGILCSGPRRGKQHTYALLDERAPAAKELPEEEALAELARRYFTSRGPATVQDFAKWAGLTATQARRGLAAVQEELERATVDGGEYWLPRDGPLPRRNAPRAHLLSIYDEYISGYRDRTAIVSAQDSKRLVGLGNALQYIIVLDGQVVGTWKRALERDAIAIKLAPFRPLAVADEEAVGEAAQRYGKFFALPVAVA